VSANVYETSSGNLTGVWAERNTREAIYDAFRRKETFATSGTRLKLRFFGGWNLPTTGLGEAKWVHEAYAEGVPMGGDLPAKPGAAAAPKFIAWGVKDPNGANLDRLQAGACLVLADLVRARQGHPTCGEPGARRPVTAPAPHYVVRSAAPGWRCAYLTGII
jgi:hypothetical protein